MTLNLDLTFKRLSDRRLKLERTSIFTSLYQLVTISPRYGSVAKVDMYFVQVIVSLLS